MKPYKLKVDKKTGFRNITGNPVVIYDQCGRVFYDTRQLENKVWKFNLPRGSYLVERGKISEMPTPVDYDLAPMPKPERFKRGNPEHFDIRVADNPNKCTVDWVDRTITFDKELCALPTPNLIFILYHEYGHRYYKSEDLCDRYASNRMLEAGYNPSQIGEALVTTLSDRQLHRKEKIVDTLTGNDRFDYYDSTPETDSNHMIGNYTNIQWNSEPVLDGWGPGDYWGPEHWITWHRKLTERWGRDRANEVLVEWYHRAGFGASSYDWRSFNPTFIAYAKDNGFYDALFTGIGGLLGKAVSTVTQTASGGLTATQNVVQGATSFVSNIGKNLTLVLGGAVAILALVLIIKVKK